MSDHCEQQFEYPTELREPTKMEWTIIEDMLEGSIIARLLTQFLRWVLDGENLLGFQRNFAAQVEGELVAQAPQVRTWFSTISSGR